MRFLFAALTSACLLQPVAFASEATPMQASVEDEFTTVASWRMTIPSGTAQWELDLEALEAGNYSFWYTGDFCRGFGISGVSYFTVEEGQEGTWNTAETIQFNNVYHYGLGTGTIALKLRTHNDRILPGTCNVHLRKANFSVPAILNVLGKVKATCAEETEEQEASCAYVITRLDGDVAIELPLLSESAEAFGLIDGAIYKFKGYMELIDETSETFRIISAQRIEL